MRDEIRFALDSLLVNRRRMVLTVAIIAVGVASLVGIVLNAILPGNDYVFGQNKLGDTSVSYRV